MDTMKLLASLCYFMRLVTSTNIYVAEGSICSLTCQTNATSTSLHWSGPDGIILTIGLQVNPNIPQKDRISVAITDRDYQLNISNIQQMDVGVYTCLFSFDGESRQYDFDLHMKVQLLSVNMNPSGPVEVQKSNTHLFQCSARSVPHAHITWYFNNSVQLSETSSSITKNTATSIFNYTGEKRDNGINVHCEASSDETIVRSLNALLNVTYGPENSSLIHPPVTSIVKLLGEQLYPIRCAADCNPSCQFEWTKDNQVIVLGDTLYIQSLEKTDHGTFNCRSWNGVGESNIHVTLTVNYGPENTDLSPDNNNYTVQEFTPLPVITCNTDCRPYCTKYWIGPNNQVIPSDTLNIGKIQRTQAGTYLCYVNNTVSSSSSFDITVIVTYGPGASQTLYPSDTSISKLTGEQLYPIRCAADCNPPCHYKWTKDSQVVMLGDTLYIQSLEKTDHGTYNCRSWNDVGESKIHVTLTVNYGPVNLTLSPDNTTYTLKELNLLPAISCNSDCRPDCTKYWIGPNNILNQSDTLNIGRIQRTQAGSYRCYANNTVSSSKSYDVKVEVTYAAEVTVMNITHSEKDHIAENTSLYFTCEAIGVPTPTIRWLFTNTSGHTLKVAEGSGFTIQKASCKYTGIYTCEADNNVFLPQNSTKTLDITSSPRLDETRNHPSRIIVTVNGSLDIDIYIIANPQPNLTWTFHNAVSRKPIADVTTEKINDCSYRSRFQKLYASLSDLGNYTVVASNGVGELFVFSTLVMIERIPDQVSNIAVHCNGDSMIVIWMPNFNGGFEQRFNVMWKNLHTNNIFRSDNIIDAGIGSIMYFTIKKLPQNAAFAVFIESTNRFGSVQSNKLVNCSTSGSSTVSEAQSKSSTFASGVGAGLGLVIFVLLVAKVSCLVFRRQKQKTSDQNRIYEKTNDICGPSDVYNELNQVSRDDSLVLPDIGNNAYVDMKTYDNQACESQDRLEPTHEGIDESNTKFDKVYMNLNI